MSRYLIKVTEWGNSWKRGITVTVLSCYNITEGAKKFSGVILAITVLNCIVSTIAQKGHKKERMDLKTLKSQNL